MSKLLVILSAILLVSFSMAFAAANGNPTEDLGHYVTGTKTKPSVIFPHAVHQEKLKDCKLCHGDDHKPLSQTEKGKLLDVSNVATFNNNFHNNFCFPCHDSKQVTSVGKNCAKCHTGK